MYPYDLLPLLASGSKIKTLFSYAARQAEKQTAALD
jgi:hypothetical protein